MAKTKLFLSVRVTEKFFTPDEIKEIKQELQTCSKSEFIRKAIKTYLNAEDKISTVSEPATNQGGKLQTIKSLVEKNHSLLQELKNNTPQQIDSQSAKDKQNSSNTYQGEEQQAKIDEALSLLEQF